MESSRSQSVSEISSGSIIKRNRQKVINIHHLRPTINERRVREGSLPIPFNADYSIDGYLIDGFIPT